MRRHYQKVVPAFRAALFLAAAAGQPLWSVEAASESNTATEGIAITGSVSNSTISNTVNQEKS
jgi:hypothetical protein